MRLARYSSLLTLAIVCAAAVTATMQVPQQMPGAIRSRITLVPLDVRVLDRNGRIVSDLRQDEVTVLEDGVPQQIGHFSQQTLEASAPGPARPSLRRLPGATLEEPTHRTFLVVLGRGRLQSGSKSYDALINFVRNQLLPQDKIAITAWNRTTDFTVDHARLIPLLERLRDTHEGIEMRLRQRESGLEGMYGSRGLPEGIQKSVDAIFADDALRPRELASVRVKDQEGFDNATRRETDAIIERMIGERGPVADPRLEDFLMFSYLGRSTVTTLYGAIEYLRYFDGEKHLVLLNEGGVYLPRAEDDEGFAAAAADARVAVHTIVTGGPPPDAAMNGVPGVPLNSVIAARGPLQSVFDQALIANVENPRLANMFAVGTLRTFSTRSGGFASGYQKVSKAFDRIDAATRSHYVIGYYPANATQDNEYRKIDVRVKRPGVTVHVRRGYYATDKFVPTDRRTFLTQSRIASAGNYSKPITDIGVTLKLTSRPDEVIAEGTIDTSRLTFEPVDGVSGGEVDLAVFVGDRKEEIIGEKWQKLSIKVAGQPGRRLIPFSVRVPVKGTAKYAKAIAYDYAADLVGTATAKIR